MKFFALLIFLLSSFTFAGTITIQGVSDIGHTPEFYKMSVDIRTKCYQTAQLSNVAISLLSSDLQTTIKENLDLETNDKIYTRAGITSRRTEISVEYVPDTRRSYTKTLCEKGWTSSRTLDIQFSDLNTWNRLNPSMLAHIDALTILESPAQVKFVEATLSPLTPFLYPETYNLMRDEALSEALTDASRQFQTIMNLCHLINPKIIKISSANNALKVGERSLSHMPESDPLSFKDLTVHMSWNIMWEFENEIAICTQNNFGITK